MRFARWLALLAFFAALPATAPAGAASIFDRLAVDRLAAEHADVLRYAQRRQTLTPPMGLQDFRAVIHCHSWLSHDSWGRLPDLVAAAKATGTRVVMLTDHPSDKHDYYQDSLSGVQEGVLFIPGAEARGFLIFPGSPLDVAAPKTPQDLVDAVNATGGLTFLSHLESTPPDFWKLTGVTGMELYNHHFDRTDTQEMRDLEEAWTERPVASDDAIARMKLILAGVQAYPQEAFAFVFDYPRLYVDDFDRAAATWRPTAVSANDTHAHWGLVLTGAAGGKLVCTGILGNPMAQVDPAKLKGLIPDKWEPGEKVLDFMLDTYERSFRHTGTHILAASLDRDSIFAALKAGHAYVSFDWLGDPTGFAFTAQAGDKQVLMGDEMPLTPGLVLQAALPIPAELRLYRNGQPIPLGEGPRNRLTIAVREKGEYRLEAWLTVGGEPRPWILSNPIYVR